MACRAQGVVLAMHLACPLSVSPQAMEIRELIIRCLSQMILARVDNVKSGWKSMFMVGVMECHFCAACRMGLCCCTFTLLSADMWGPADCSFAASAGMM
jgi:hypothetical protein